MAQRLLKIILPESHGAGALNVLAEQGVIDFWQEESVGDHHVISVLIDAGRSESLMDHFEKTFSYISGFRLILIPVEAAIPRVEEAADSPTDQPANLQPIDSARISREELYQDIVDSTKLSGFYVAMVLLSTVVAAIGLLKDNVAVIIGAMVIAPFLGPNVALALSTCLADYDLGKNSLKTLVSGVAAAFCLAVGLGLFLPVDPALDEIASRTQASMSDIALAMASGAAGVLAFTTGVSATLIGVMVAVALLPPLTVAGLMLGAGYLNDSFFAFLLFMTNIICINLSGIITFLVRGISPRTWWEADQAKKSTRKALLTWSVILILLIAIIILWKTD
jgi:uncharacterized hydrophobic protein (TIGR00341 family)